MDARCSPQERDYANLRGVVSRLKSVASGFRADMDQDMPVRSLANILRGTKRLKDLISGFYSPSVKTLAGVIHNDAGDAGYDLLADLQNLQTLVDAVNAEVLNVVPLSPDGSIQERTIDSNGDADILVPAANLATLRTLTDNLINAIQVN